MNSDQGSQFTRIRLCRPSGNRSASSAWTGGARRKQCVRRAPEVGEVRADVVACLDSVAKAGASIIQYLDGDNRSRLPFGLGQGNTDETYAVMLPTVELAA